MTITAGNTTLSGFLGVADLRTPRTTFDTFCRSILTGQAPTLWKAVDSDLRHSMQDSYYREGEDRFFHRMRPLVSNPVGRLNLGQPGDPNHGVVACPVLRAGRQVATARFRFSNQSWLLTSLN